MDTSGGSAAMLDPSMFAHMSTDEVKGFFERLMQERQKQPEVQESSVQSPSTDESVKLEVVAPIKEEEVFETCPQEPHQADPVKQELDEAQLPDTQFETCPSDPLVPLPEKEPPTAPIPEDGDVFMSAESSQSSSNDSKPDLNTAIITSEQESSSETTVSPNTSASSVQSVHATTVDLSETSAGEASQVVDMDLREPFPSDSSVVSIASGDSQEKRGGDEDEAVSETTKKSPVFSLVAYDVDDSSDNDEVEVLEAKLMPPPVATSSQKSSSQDSFSTWRAPTPKLKKPSRVIVDVSSSDDSDWSDWEDPLQAARTLSIARKARAAAASGSDDDSDSGSDASSVASFRSRAGKKKQLDLTADGIYGLKDLPPVEMLSLDEPPIGPFRQLGVIAHHVNTLLMVRSFKNEPTLDVGSKLFVKDGAETLGRIFDVIGRVNEPYYVVRFNSAAEIASSSSHAPDAPVFFAPQCPNSSKFVFPAQLRLIKGTDASGIDDIEVDPDDSDDDDVEAKKQQAAKRPAEGNEQNFRGNPRRFIRGRRRGGWGAPGAENHGNFPQYPPHSPHGNFPQYPPPPLPHHQNHHGPPPPWGGPPPQFAPFGAPPRPGPPMFGRGNVMANIFSRHPRPHFNPRFGHADQGQWNQWGNPS